MQTRSLRGQSTGDKPARGVEVWHADLDVDAETLARLTRTLSEDETARAVRFRFDRDRRRFIAGRGILRARLAEAAGIEPARLEFSYGTHGKPSLRPETGGAGLFFNLAHSGNHAIVAVTSVAEVGVDIEVIRPVRDAAAIGRRCFSEQERAALALVPAQDQDVAFFYAWTRKEAYVKAVGAGLSYPLQSFDVAVTPGEPARILRAPDPALVWSMADVSHLPAYAAAVVVRAPYASLHLKSKCPIGTSVSPEEYSPTTRPLNRFR